MISVMIMLLWIMSGLLRNVDITFSCYINPLSVESADNFQICQL